jgi:hypothetical protein
MRTISFLLAVLISSATYAQKYILSNEAVIFSFHTTSGKRVFLIKDKEEKYISYRFGTNNKIELEFPADKKGSWTRFKYSYYLRGGGKANKGLDLNYVYFTNNGFKYILYQNYNAVENKTDVGLRIMDIKTNKTFNIPGKYSTKQGTLVDFRDNGLLSEGDEIFD